MRKVLREKFNFIFQSKIYLALLERRAILTAPSGLSNGRALTEKWRTIVCTNRALTKVNAERSSAADVSSLETSARSIAIAVTTVKTDSLDVDVLLVWILSLWECQSFIETFLGNCRTRQCQCYFASWECDPDICKSCNCGTFFLFLAMYCYIMTRKMIVTMHVCTILS